MSSQPDPKDRLSIDAAYGALAGMRQTYDQMLWQTPALSLTAQAFLLTIAYDISGSLFYRVVAGLMASMIGLASWHLFQRHRHFEREVSVRLQELEEQYLGFAVHKKRQPIPNEKSIFGILSLRSGPLWAWMLFILSVAGILPVIECLCHGR